MDSSTQGVPPAQAGNDTPSVQTASTQVPEHTPSLLSFDPGVSIWTLGIFIVLLIVLKKLAWKPIIDSLDAREKTIKSSLDQAAHIQAENARLALEQSRILDEAKNQAGQIVQTAREAAEGLKRSMEASAQEEKKRIVASATLEIEASKQAAISELKKTTAQLSIGIAEKLIRQNLDDAKNHALVEQLIQEVSRKA
jgi:F-type H+-transporting ATPase subunit b